jgi:hypothetical protein
MRIRLFFRTRCKAVRVFERGCAVAWCGFISCDACRSHITNLNYCHLIRQYKSLQAPKESPGCGNIHFIFLTDPRSSLQKKKKCSQQTRLIFTGWRSCIYHFFLYTMSREPHNTKNRVSNPSFRPKKKTPQTPSKSLVIICKRVYISHTLPPRLIKIITHPIRTDRKQRRKKHILLRVPLLLRDVGITRTSLPDRYLHPPFFLVGNELVSEAGQIRG